MFRGCRLSYLRVFENHLIKFEIRLQIRAGRIKDEFFVSLGDDTTRYLHPDREMTAKMMEDL
jgi:hypothetical protein